MNDQSVNYCAMVDAQSPYPAYNGEQAYIVEAQMAGNKVTPPSWVSLPAAKTGHRGTMCAKYGLDPNKSS